MKTVKHGEERLLHTAAVLLHAGGARGMYDVVGFRSGGRPM